MVFKHIFKIPTLGGDLFNTFLLISRICFPPGWFYMAYAIRKLKIFFLTFFLMFYTRYKGSEKPNITQNMKIIVQGCLIAQMKRFDALITTQKIPALCKVPFIKREKKKRPKKMVIHKSSNFWRLFPKWDSAESWGFLRCNLCIKMVQTPTYDDFNFWGNNGFLHIFRPLVRGLK